jgi:hypothetical protein
MKSADAVRIAGTAVTLMDNFCKNGRRPENLLPREGERVHRELRDFAHSVVHFEHYKDWGTGSYINRDAANKVQLFMTADVRSLPAPSRPNNLQGYGSWLYRNFAGSYAAIFDEQLISSATATSFNRILPTEAIARLFLHELGHFVLHRQHLFKDHHSSGLAASALAEMEAEAWFFAYVIVGLARGDRAALTTAAVDNTWLKWP